MTADRKPLGGKSYGHIPHLPGSRMGPGDHACHEGQKRICTEQVRDKHDTVIVQEKLDGSNVGVYRRGDELIPLTRAGYVADTSPYEMHHLFYQWALEPAQRERFMDVLADGDRLCGEWLAQAHSTRYNLPHEPFVAFDLMRTAPAPVNRLSMALLENRLRDVFVMPRILHRGGPFSIEQALAAIETSGHGAIDPVEGAVWRVERFEQLDKRVPAGRFMKVDFLAKYVRPEKKDGIYLPEQSGGEAVWNWRPA